MTHTCPGCGKRLHSALDLTNCRYHWGKPPHSIAKTYYAERVAEILAWAETPAAERVWPPVGR